VLAETSTEPATVQRFKNTANKLILNNAQNLKMHLKLARRFCQSFETTAKIEKTHKLLLLIVSISAQILKEQIHILLATKDIYE